MKPLLFKPVYVERIWGGRDLEKYRDDMQEGVIGERWDVGSGRILRTERSTAALDRGRNHL